MNSISINSPDKRRGLETFAKYGFLMKGIVYILIGVLAAMTAFGLGGSINGKTDILKIILEQPFGRILLGFVGIGLLGYTAWRWTQAFIDPENDYNDKKGVFTRIAFFFSGFVYGTLATYALKMAIQGYSSNGGGTGRSTVIGKILEMPAGEIIVGIMALFIIGKGLYGIWKGISKKFMDKINGFGYKTKEVVERAGQAGYIARGIVLGIIGYLTMRAAIESNASAAKGTEGAFEFLFSNTNAWLVGLVAVGFALYGLFMIIKSKEFYIR